MPKLPKHLRKALALLFGVLVLIFVLPRFMPTSSALERYGFYPAKYDESTQFWSTRSYQFTETAVCGTCHADKKTTWSASAHAGVNCQDCHGAGEQHVEKGTKLVADTSREACAVCHDKVVGRPASFPQVDAGQHNVGADCVTCHNPHNPRIAAPPAIPHSLEGRADCLLCHNTGALKPFPADHQGRPSTSCTGCHGSK